MDSPPFAPEEAAEFESRSKSRFRRRLKARWQCQMPDHTYCFTKVDGTHLPLSDEDMERWVSTLHNGEATLLIPPNGICQSGMYRTEVDMVSIRSTIQYQRPFQWQNKHSLADFRSMRMRLGNSITSSSNFALSTSTGSSGEPGIGYVLGKAVKWVGVQTLGAFELLAIPIRRQVISDLIKQLERIPQQDRSQWIFKRSRAINRAVEDLLELSTEQYNTNYRTTATHQGARLRSLIQRSTTLLYSEENVCICSILVKLFPLSLLSEYSSSSSGFPIALRETLLQDPPDIVNERPLIAEIASQLCIELAYGLPSPWRDKVYETLCVVYQTGHGGESLQDLGRNGPLIKHLSSVAFTNAVQLSISEHTWAICFFALHGNDAPEYRTHLLSPTGIPLLVKNIKLLHREFNNTGTATEEFCNLCQAFSRITEYNWCIPMLIQCDICSDLVGILILTERSPNADTSWAAHSLIWTLRDIAVCGGRRGRQAVANSATDNLRQTLPGIISSFRRFYGDPLATQIRGLITETWHGWSVRD